MTNGAICTARVISRNVRINLLIRSSLSSWLSMAIIFRADGDLDALRKEFLSVRIVVLHHLHWDSRKFCARLFAFLNFYLEFRFAHD